MLTQVVTVLNDLALQPMGMALFYILRAHSKIVNQFLSKPLVKYRAGE